MKRRQKADSRASEEKTEDRRQTAEPTKRRQKADSRASEEKTEGRQQSQ